MTSGNYVSDSRCSRPAIRAPGVAQFRFTPLSGKAAARAVCGLQPTQDVVVLAETSDGQFFPAQKRVKVTIGGCGG